MQRASLNVWKIGCMVPETTLGAFRRTTRNHPSLAGAITAAAQIALDHAEAGKESRKTLATYLNRFSQDVRTKYGKGID